MGSDGNYRFFYRHGGAGGQIQMGLASAGTDISRYLIGDYDGNLRPDFAWLAKRSDTEWLLYVRWNFGGSYYVLGDDPTLGALNRMRTG